MTAPTFADQDEQREWLFAHLARYDTTPDGRVLIPGSNGSLHPHYVRDVVYSLLHGSIPEGRVTLATCGDDICANPQHIVLVRPA